MAASADGEFHNHMAVDFCDDQQSAPYSRATLDEMMEICKRLGFKRLYWIYHGKRDSGFWDPTGARCLFDRNIEQMFENLGTDNDLKTAVEAAHEAGLEIYAIYKPFETAPLAKNLPLDSEDGKRYGKCPILGGTVIWGMNEPLSNPGMMMQRRNGVSNTFGKIGKIVLQSVDKGSALPGEITLWTSANNGTYERYSGNMLRVDEPGRVELKDLQLDAPFLAVQVAQENHGENKFQNRLEHLVKIFDTQGREIAFTYGLVPRSFRNWEENSFHLDRKADKGGGFSQEGFFYDLLPGIPSCCFSPDIVRERLFALDNEDGVTGLAIGHNSFVCAPDPSEPAAREYWLKQIEEILDAGVDGVDLRVTAHNSILDWEEYGYNVHALEKYREIHDADPDPADTLEKRLDWRRIRGEFYSSFLCSARNIIKAKGKKIQLHICDAMEVPEGTAPMMNMDWNWHEWIAAGLADEVTIKAMDHRAVESSFGRELIDRCKSAGVPVYYCPFLHSLMGENPEAGKKYINDTIRKSGMDGMIYYEFATCFTADRNETLKCLTPEWLP